MSTDDATTPEGQVPFVRDGKYLGSTNATTCPHSNARSTGDTCSDGCCDYYYCPDCRRRFLVECPD